MSFNSGAQLDTSQVTGGGGGVRGGNLNNCDTFATDNR